MDGRVTTESQLVQYAVAAVYQVVDHDWTIAAGHMRFTTA